MKMFRPFVLAAAILGSILTAAFAAESPSVLLQKGIFAEETEGNLDAAITIYQQITAEAATQRAIAAQAQYRLGVCLQKKGDKEQAIGALNDLLRQFPAEAALGQKARVLLAGLGHAPAGQITMRELPLNLSAGAAVSRDGRLIAYWAKGESGVMVHEFSTGKTWKTIAPNGASSIVFSPDGKKIAYRHSWAIHTVNLDGTDAREVLASNKDLGGRIFDWSSDGGHLIIGQWSPAVGAIFATLDLATGAIRKIWETPAVGKLAIQANESTDGRFLAYRRSYMGGDRAHTFILDQVTNTEAKFTDKEIVGLIGWFRGSTKLLFTSNRSGTTGLWAIAVRDGQPAGEPELIKADLGNITPLGLTADGSLFYSEAKHSKNIHLATVDFTTGEILQQPRRVADRFAGEQAYPVWSKDGQKLMFATRNTLKRFVAVPLGAGAQKDYPVWETFTSDLFNYAWAHDGSYILACGTSIGSGDRGHGIHRYDLASGAIETLARRVIENNNGPWICHPRITPDGQSFCYVRREFFGPSTPNGRDWNDLIIRRHLQSGQEDIVYRAPEKLQIWWPYELSPDGQLLAIVNSNEYQVDSDFVGRLQVHDLRSGKTRELMRTEPRKRLNSLAWTPDGKRLVYSMGEETANNRAKPIPSIIWSIAVTGGQPVEIKFDEADVGDLALHPDGRQIAFRAGPGGETKLWVLEGLTTKTTSPAARTASN